MKIFHDLAREVLANGIDSKDRTGAGTISYFGPQIRMDLRKGFPLLTTKKTSLKNIFTELMWFLKGDTRVSTLVRQGCNIWNADWKRTQLAKKSAWMTPEICDSVLARMREGENFKPSYDDLPEIYGKQWRDWDGVDQVKELLYGLQNNPDSRRHILSAWNVPKIKDMALPPCHTMSQFYVRDGKLSCKLYQRSGDLFLGVGYNIASYALLTMMVARHCDLEAHEFIHTFGDLHIYKSHRTQVDEMLSREPRPLPTLTLNPEKKDLFSWEWSDLTLTGYDPYPAIKAPLEVG